MVLCLEFGDFEPRSQEEGEGATPLPTLSLMLSNGAMGCIAKIREIRAIRVQRFYPPNHFYEEIITMHCATSQPLAALE